MPNWSGISIHHTASSDDEHEDTEAIRKFHVEDRNWSDIGYNGLIEEINGSYEYMKGRGTDTIGAHVSGMNSQLLGLSFVGNFEKTVPATEKIMLGADKVTEWMDEFDIRLSQVKPHREWDSDTVCPGAKFPFEQLTKFIKQNWRTKLSQIDEWGIKQQQRGINLLGIDAGPVDGIRGEKTKKGLSVANDRLLQKKSVNYTASLRDAILNTLNSNSQQPVTEMVEAFNRIHEKYRKLGKEIERFKTLYLSDKEDS